METVLWGLRGNLQLSPNFSNLHNTKPNKIFMVAFLTFRQFKIDKNLIGKHCLKIREKI